MTPEFETEIFTRVYRIASHGKF